MKLLLISVFLAMSAPAAESLADFRWKKRLLVVTGDGATASKELTTAKQGLAERDVKVFFLNGPGMEEALAKSLRERLKVRAGVAEVLLLSKDGHTTLRWRVDEFNVAALFAKIDAMPMRKAEMRGD